MQLLHRIESLDTGNIKTCSRGSQTIRPCARYVLFLVFAWVRTAVVSLNMLRRREHMADNYLTPEIGIQGVSGSALEALNRESSDFNHKRQQI